MTDDALALLEQVEAELAEVERALARLDDGTYGTCEVCAQPIPDGDLAADPTARLCAAHRPANPAPTAPAEATPQPAAKDAPATPADAVAGPAEATPRPAAAPAPSAEGAAPASPASPAAAARPAPDGEPPVRSPGGW